MENLKVAFTLLISLLSLFYGEAQSLKVPLYKVWSPPSSASTAYVSSLFRATSSDSSSLTPWGVTACAFVRPLYYREINTVFMSLSSIPPLQGDDTSAPLDLDASVGLTADGMLVVREGPNVFPCKMKTGRQLAQVQISITEWNHICLVVTEKYTQVFNNGHFVQGYNVSHSRQEEFRVSIGGGNSWTLRGEENNKDEGSFVGDIAVPEVWLNVVPPNDIRDRLSKCEKLSVEPKPATWLPTGDALNTTEIERVKPCEEQLFDYVVLPHKQLFDRNALHCSQYGMVTVEPLSQYHYNSIYNDVNEYASSCFDGGIGGWLSSTNSLERECRGITEYQGVQAISCSSRLCGLCQFRKVRPKFYLRGMCSIHDEDLSFVVGKHENISMYFQGVTGHVIIKTENSWQLLTSLGGALIAEVTSTHVIGTQEWQMKSSYCDKPIDSKVLVSFNFCDMQQSWCDSGACIPAKQRCNSFTDCDDGSDEKGCRSFGSYKLAAMNDFSLPKKPVEVGLQIEILRIVQEDDYKPIEAVLKSRLTWVDTETVFDNIKSDITNKLPVGTLAWTPIVVPAGAPPDPRTCIGLECDDPVALIAYTNNQPLPDTRELAVGDKQFGNASLQLTRLSVHSLDCSGQQLTYFPFEEHICELNFSPSTLQFQLKTQGAQPPNQHTVHFIVEKVQLKRQEHEIDGVKSSRAILRFHVKRLIGFYVVTIFIPSFFLLIINSAVLWVIDSAEFRLNTSFSVFISFLIQWLIIACNAPKSSTIRALDVWMSFCTVHALLHILVHITHKALNSHETNAEATPHAFSRMSSRPGSRLRQVKPLETTNLYDALLAKLASEENENTWTHGYWIMFSARVVSPALTLLFMVSYWPFVIFYTKQVI